MREEKSIKRNYIMSALLTASSMIFPLISYPYVSRILQPDGMGKVAFANSLISYFALIAMLGIPTYGIRACARVRDDKEQLSKVVWELLSINLCMTLLVYVILGISVFYVPRLAADKTIFLLMSISILFQMLGAEWLFKALEEYSYITIRSIVFKFIALVAMFLAVKEKEDYVVYGLLTIFAAVGSNLCNAFYMRRYIASFRSCFIKKQKIVTEAFEKHFKSILIFFAMSAATTIYTNLDVAMLGFMQSDAEAGYYNAAIKIKMVLVSFVTALGSVLLPRLSYYIEQHKEKEFWKMIRKVFVFVLVVSVPLCIFFIVFAKYSILILAGEDYLPAVLPMQIIMPTLILIGLSNISGIQILVPLGLEKQVLYSELLGASVDVMINLWLISDMGATGAAIGTLVAEAVVLLYQISVVACYRKKLYSNGIKKQKDK